MNYEDYYKYLLKRGNMGYLYRRYFLYPRLNRYLFGRVLDFGCGIGDFLSFRSNTIGVDINPFVIEHCQQLGLQAYHIEQLPTPFQDMTFQGAVLDNVLEHLDKPEQVLKEITRVLSHNAVLIVGVPGEKGYKSDPDHKRFYDEISLKDLITRFGFTWIRTLHMPFRLLKINPIKNQYCIYGIFLYSIL
jgi:SAM-dependent methyltransferase